MAVLELSGPQARDPSAAEGRQASLRQARDEPQQGAAQLRLGIGEVHDRPPALPPTPFGLASTERYAAHLGAYGAPVS